MLKRSRKVNNIDKVSQNQTLERDEVMANISDIIEKYLKELFNSTRQEQVEIQRNELAEQFGCVPSQINYVLTTRFTLERGFVVQSRRGGGGYVRIIRIPIDNKTDLVTYLTEMIGDSISQKAAEGITLRLFEEGIITRRELALMLAAIDSNVLNIEIPVRDKLRASILKSMIISIMQYKDDKKGD